MSNLLSNWQKNILLRLYDILIYFGVLFMKIGTYLPLLFLPLFLSFSQLNANKVETTFYKDNRSPLLWAVLQGKNSEVEALLKSGMNPNILYNGEPLVHYTIKKGNLEIATSLVNAGADFSGKISDNYDAFTYVSIHFNDRITNQGKLYRYLDLDLLNAFISKGYDLRANFESSNLQINCWYLALKNNQNNKIAFFLNQYKEYLLPYSANPNQIFSLDDRTTITPLLILLDNYLKHFSSVDSRKKLLSQGSSMPQIGVLLKAGADINQSASPESGKNFYNPLSYALAKKDDGYVINSLLENGADLTQAIRLFVANGFSPNYEILCRWFQTGFTVSLFGLAVEKNDVNAVKELLDVGADINKLTSFMNTRGTFFVTPLGCAFKENNHEMIELFLDKGGRV